MYLLQPTPSLESLGTIWLTVSILCRCLTTPRICNNVTQLAQIMCAVRRALICSLATGTLSCDLFLASLDII